MLWALFAALLLGGAFFGLGAAVHYWGWFWPCFLESEVTLLLLLPFSVCWHTQQQAEEESNGMRCFAVSLGCIAGLLETCGLLIYVLTAHLIPSGIAIEASVSTCYALIPVTCGVVLFGERLHHQQWAGMVLVLVALALSSSGVLGSKEQKMHTHKRMLQLFCWEGI